MKNELKKRILTSVILIPIVFIFVIKGSFYFSLLLITTLFISFYEWYFLAKKKPYFIPGLFFLIFSFYSTYQIRNINDNSYQFFLIILVICISTDIGGYVFGKTLKGPKLTPHSPNKTISGLIGSYIFALCSIPFLIYFNQLKFNQLFSIIIFVILLSTISQLGDILISFFKRKSKLKDTGNIIPGHGGLLDRIDGMLFAFPAAYLITSNNLIDKI